MSQIKVVLGPTSIALVRKNEVLTSIPNRVWSSSIDDQGRQVWSSRSRATSEMLLLVSRLEGEFSAESSDPVLMRLHKVLTGCESVARRQTRRRRTSLNKEAAERPSNLSGRAKCNEKTGLAPAFSFLAHVQ
jgi:hypothetical protein